MTTKLICLIGASGSGKTTVAKELEKVGCNVIQSYTTRPPRHKDEWGHTFIDEGGVAGWVGDIFRTVDWLDTIGVELEFHKSDMIAYFNSYNSGHHYFATDEQVIRGKTNIYIVDPKGAEMVHDFYKGTDVEVITIYLQVDRGVRRKRMIDRGTPTISQLRCGKTYLYQELLKEVSERLSKDDILFQTVKCDYAVDVNSELNTVLANIEKIIEVEND